MRAWVRRLTIAQFLVLLLPLAAAAQAPPVLQASEETARAGYFRLDWSAPLSGSEQYVLELRDGTQAASREIYRGTDTARVESGLADGLYVYRVRVEGAVGPGPWSDPVRVEVAHHPLPRALGFLAVGLLVFLATLGLIVSGVRAAAKERA